MLLSYFVVCKIDAYALTVSLFIFVTLAPILPQTGLPGTGTGPGYRVGKLGKAPVPGNVVLTIIDWQYIRMCKCKTISVKKKIFFVKS